MSSKQKDLPGVPPTLDSTIDELTRTANIAKATMLTLARKADSKLPLAILANSYKIAAAIEKLTAQLNSFRPE